MVPWLVAMSVLIVLVSGRAWRYQLRVAGLIGLGSTRVASCAGSSTDVQLTSVLALEPIVLLEFQAATTTLYATGRPTARAGHRRQSLVVSLDGDPAASIAMLRGWEASGVAVVMWRDGSGGRIELSLLRTGQRV